MRDTSFSLRTDEVRHAYLIQIVRDSILVMAEGSNVPGEECYKAYSLNSCSYLGALVREGRGPNEFLSPRISRGCSGDKYLKINDNWAAKIYDVDVMESILTQKPYVVAVSDLPSGVVNWCPLPDSRSFMLLTENEELLYKVTDSEGRTDCEFHTYPDFIADCCLTYLSGILLGRGLGGNIAEVMLYLPQINIFDTDKNGILSIAVNKDYKKWKSMINRAMGFNTYEYYSGAAVSQDYIFASYVGQSLGEIAKGNYTTSIHIFDWEGNWLYDIKVGEKVDAMAYDSRGKYLYAIDKTEDRLVRYDFTELL